MTSEQLAVYELLKCGNSLAYMAQSRVGSDGNLERSIEDWRVAAASANITIAVGQSHRGPEFYDPPCGGNSDPQVAADIECLLGVIDGMVRERGGYLAEDQFVVSSIKSRWEASKE